MSAGGGDVSSAQSVPVPTVGDQNVGNQTANSQAATNQTVGNPNINNQTNGDNFGNVNETQSSSEKDTPDDILEKFIMIIRALEDEWAQFSKSKQYKDLPDDGDDPLFDRRKANVISRYRAAMNYSLAED